MAEAAIWTATLPGVRTGAGAGPGFGSAFGACAGGGGGSVPLNGSVDATGGAGAAAVRAAREQRVADETAWIEYETADGQWVTERADGHDRPQTDVED